MKTNKKATLKGKPKKVEFTSEVSLKEVRETVEKESGLLGDLLNADYI